MPTPNSGIPYVPENTTDPAAGLNLALNVIDALLQTAVIDMDLTAPPGSPSDGDLHIVGAGATGAWTGEDGNLARYVSEGAFWQFYEAGTQVKLILNLYDGGIHAYLSGAWSLVGGLSDAPSDGSNYGRKDGAWEVVSGSGPPPVLTEATTALAADDTNAGNYTRFTNAGAKTYTFDDAETYVVGDEYHGRNVGAGDLTITAAGTMTINAPAAGTLVIPQGGTFTVKIVAADEADLFGVTVAL